MERYIEQFHISYSKKYCLFLLTFWLMDSSLSFPINSIYSLSENIKVGILFRIYCILTRSNRISDFCRIHSIAKSISHWEIANIFNILSKFFWNKATIIIVIHNTFDKKSLWFLLYFLCRFFYRFADHIVSVSQELSENISLVLPSVDIVTIYNSFDIKSIQILKNESIDDCISTILNNWKINICNIGRLDQNKNQSLLLDYFHIYFQENKDIQLFLIGGWDEYYMNILLQKISEFNLSESVFFLWRQDNIYKYLDKMHYACYTNLQEWFWRSLVDPLILWIPVLTHDYMYWAKEIIRYKEDFIKATSIEIHENGILTEFMNEKQYIDAMRLMIQISFDKKMIIGNTKKYSPIYFQKSWDLLLI